MAELTATVHGAKEWQNIRLLWTQIHACTPQATIFSSAEWVESWLTTVGRDVSCDLLVVTEGQVPIGVCLLASNSVRRGPFQVKTCWFGTAGEPEQDSVFVEFGDVLCLPGKESEFAEALSGYIARQVWDELVFPRMNPSTALEATIARFERCFLIREDLPSRYLDLSMLRGSDTRFEDTLPRKLRQQIRQSIRIYEEDGPVGIHVATSACEANQMLLELAELHEASWKARGLERGAFGSKRFVDFHRQLISSVFANGGALLARVTAGERPIGLIYNLVSNGTLYFYQSGLAYHVNNRVKPGFVCQVLCINYCCDAGFDYYDFMGGDTPYKKELGREDHNLVTITLRRRSIKLRGIEFLRSTRHQVRRMLKSGMDPKTEEPQ